MKPSAKEAAIDIVRIETGTLECYVLGTTPFICNRVSEKGWRELLMPRKRTAADKAAILKHNPLEEFRASPYMLRDESAPTLLATLATAFKGCMRTAALDLPGAVKKAQIGRLTYARGEYVGLYGIPKIMCSIIRSADINRTPDVRTRAIIPQWAALVSVTYTKPLLNMQSVANLLAAGGVTAGVGDWRVEKGSGNFGMFELVEPNDPRLKHILKHGARQAQIDAMESPEPYDRETGEMLSWYDVELKRRGAKAPV